MTNRPSLAVPSAWLPIGISLVALAVVTVHIAYFGTAHEVDEGAAARIWQIHAECGELGAARAQMQALVGRHLLLEPLHVLGKFAARSSLKSPRRPEFCNDFGGVTYV